MKILFIGPIVENCDVSGSEAVSPAANQWQLDLIEGLVENGVEVSVLSYLPERAWPKGRLYVQNKPFIDPTCSFTYVGYANIPVVRFSILRYKFIRALQSICNNDDSRPDFLITYNATEPNCGVGHYFQEKYNGKWISIIADGYSQGKPDSEIFLSYGYFRKSQLFHKLHLDGAPPVFQGEKVLQPARKIIIYSGSLDIWTGIENFVKQFSELNLSEFELHIYGKGQNSEIARIADNNQNISLKGFVPSVELSNASKKAFAFVNPRPTHLPGVENNFPSKILQYISFGKPILSTKTKGISPLYDELLNYYDPQDITTLQKQFLHLSTLTRVNLLDIFEKSKLFCERNTWKNHAAKIVALCGTLE